MAGINYNGGNPFIYITEDTVNGTLLFNPPNRFGVISAQFKLECDDTIINNSNTQLLSFFTGVGVPQQATPVNLLDVISVLQAYGLTS